MNAYVSRTGLMPDSIATPAKTESAQPDFSHGLLEFRTKSQDRLTDNRAFRIRASTAGSVASPTPASSPLNA
jgi:hypothetical protein